MYSYNNIVQKQAPRDAHLLEGVELSASAPANMTWEKVPEVDAVLIHNILSPEECNAVLTACDTIGWTFWRDANAGVKNTANTEGKNDGKEEEELDAFDRQKLQSHAQPECSDDDEETEKDKCGDGAEGEDPEAAARAFRSADTIEVDLHQFTSKLWPRVLPCITQPTVVISEEDEERYERDAEGTWVASGLNPNCLFARYLEGGHFAPHIDGTTLASFNERSQYTLLVYLCDCSLGGETNFMVGNQCEVLAKNPSSGKITGNGTNIVGSMKPVCGSAVLFFHDVLHEGYPVGDFNPDTMAEAPRKIILRGDVMYKRTPPLHDEPSDREAFELYQKARLLEADGDSMAAMLLFKRIRRLSPGIADVYQL